MTILPNTYMPNRPAEHRVTVLDTPKDILGYQTDNGSLPDGDRSIRGLYRVQLIENGVPAAGPGLLLTEDQFQEEFSDFAEPYFEFGVKCLPRRKDIVVHGNLDTSRDALAELPVPKASGDYGIVRPSGSRTR